MQEVEEQLKMIQDLVEDKVIEDIRQFFKQIINEELKSFDDYRNIVIYDINLLKMIDNLINETLININRTTEELETSNTNEVKEQIDKHLGTEIFRYVQEFKESLLGDLEKMSKNEGTLNFHEKKGTELWKITVDYRNAAKGQWDKLKLFNKEDIKDNDLKRSSEVTG